MYNICHFGNKYVSSILNVFYLSSTNVGSKVSSPISPPPSPLPYIESSTFGALNPPLVPPPTLSVLHF